MEKYGFVYIWFDKKHQRFYIGCHWGTEDDGYVCSSRWMRKAYKRRPEDFKRRILCKINNRDDLFDEEYKWLQQIKSKELGKRYYNITKHKHNHSMLNEENKNNMAQKISETLKKKHQDDPEYRKIYLKGRKKLRGRKHSQELVEKRKQSIINGKKSCLEHKKQVSESMKEIWKLRKEGKLPMVNTNRQRDAETGRYI